MRSPRRGGAALAESLSCPATRAVAADGTLAVEAVAPVSEQGLRPGRRYVAVGTLYDPEDVGPHLPADGTPPAPIPRGRRGAWRARCRVRVPREGHAGALAVSYRYRAPELAGREVSVVTTWRRRRRWPLALLLVAALLASLAAWRLLGWRDPAAGPRAWDDPAAAAATDEDVPWYAMQVAVAWSMEVAEGDTSVEACIENPAANDCDQRVRIYETDDPTDVLFESGGLSPGDSLQWVELSHPLSPGTHDVTVEFQGYERGVSLLSDEGVPLGHDTFGSPCAVEATIWCAPAAAARA